MTHLQKSIENRRTYYGISAKSPLSATQIAGLVKHALKHTPSAFNMQSARIVLLRGKAHQLLWDETFQILKPLVPAAGLEETRQRIASFRAGHGTVLFFDDMPVVETFAKQFALYKDNFPIWAQQANGMLQSNIWMSLEDAGLGASLQHYNPLIDKMVQRNWHVPAAWRLAAQMPFGTPTRSPEKKTFQPLAKRFKSYAK